MITSRDRIAAAVVNNKIYVFGGRNSNGFLSTVEVYDPLTDTWSIKTSMPTQREGLVSAVVINKIYVIGGCNNSGAISVVEMYDPTLDP